MNSRWMRDSGEEKSIALAMAPNKIQNLQQALELQVFPSAIMGHIYINLSILAFVTIGYTAGGKFFQCFILIKGKFSETMF